MESVLFINLPGASEWILILFAGVWIAAVVDVATSKFQTPNSKITWLLITILLGAIGALLYWLVGRKYKIPKE